MSALSAMSSVCDSDVLVGTDARSLEGFGAQLLILVGHQVDAGREFIDVRTFTAQIEDADLGVWHTTVEAGFRVWLSDIFISLCSACAHAL